MKARISTGGGFSLVEVALALAVAAFCLITLMALLPVGIRSYRGASVQSVMVNMATMVERDLEATPSVGASPRSPRFGFSIPSAGGAASGNTPQTIFVDASETPAGTYPYPGSTPSSSSIYRVSVYFMPPPSMGQRTATLARILITFPAHADATPTANPQMYADVFQTMVSLNRN